MHNIGDTLREERVRRGQTPAEVARDVGAPKATLYGLEAGTLSLDDAHTRGYLRMYARHLGLDAEALLRQLNEDPDAPPTDDVAGSSPDRPGAAFWAPDSNGNGNGHTPPVFENLIKRRVPGVPSLTGGSRQALGLGALGVLAAVVAAIGVVMWAPRDGGESTVALSPPAEESAPTEQQEQASPPLDPDTPAAPPPAEAAAPEGGAASVRAPEDTPVQVLHNDISQSLIDEVVDLLESFGYDVVWVNSAGVRFSRTTIYAVDGWEAEAEALAARDDRLSVVSSNDRFSTDVPLHVAIGPDWARASRE